MTPVPAPVRRLLKSRSDRLVTYLAPRVWTRLEPEVRETAEDVSRGHGRAIVVELDRREITYRDEHAAIRQQLHDDVYWANNKTELVGSAVAAVEARLGALERTVADRAAASLAALEAGDAPDVATALAEARLALADVRTEHARIRARLTVVAAYEERLERLENDHPANGPRVPAAESTA